jgi:hypothetical protein
MSMRRWLYNQFLGCLVEGKINIQILFASVKNLTNSESWPGSRIIISVPASLSVIDRLSPVFSPH